MKYFFPVLLAFMLTACNSMPEKNFEGDFDSVSPADIEALYIKDKVRWAGEIIRTAVFKDHSCIDVLGKRQKANARPEKSNESEGRFRACASGFHDPALYRQGKQLTVSGSYEGVTQEMIGEYPYALPVVTVDALYLWDEETKKASGSLVFWSDWRHLPRHRIWLYPYPLHGKKHSEN